MANGELSASSQPFHSIHQNDLIFQNISNSMLYNRHQHICLTLFCLPPFLLKWLSHLYTKTHLFTERYIHNPHWINKLTFICEAAAGLRMSTQAHQSILLLHPLMTNIDSGRGIITEITLRREGTQYLTLNKQINSCTGMSSKCFSISCK